ncbi:hypothetical protein ABW19_dt0201875 [Dactylella cylindrospora]|nr:hypothetical protein ABW19_dt0201875 [Dactylella cylindrospora]
MSSKSLSPTASLIRNSRLMAVPPPISHSFADTQIFRSLAPTHQAITTPESSRSRGDWGLKRPIPRKVDNHYIRYSNIDTIEHRTTFESSHDTVVTVKKWQEMGIPLIARGQSANKLISVFKIDGQAPKFDPNSQSMPQSEQENSYDWGYREKFVQHMTQGELRAFIAKNIIPRRREFQQFIVARGVQSRMTAPFAETAAESAMGNDNSPSAVENGINRSSEIPSDGESINSDLKTIRYDETALKPMVINEFLKIPLRQVPMPFHPSGGLHYIFDSSYLENDAELGPNPNNEVPARLINRIAGTRGEKLRTLYIIGGIVQIAQQDTSIETDYNISRVVKVIPLSAEFDHQGKIRIQMDRITPIYNYEKMLGSSQEHFKRRQANRQSDEETVKSTSSSTNYLTARLVDAKGRSPEGPEHMNDRLLHLINALNTDDLER